MQGEPGPPYEDCAIIRENSMQESIKIPLITNTKEEEAFLKFLSVLELMYTGFCLLT